MPVLQISELPVGRDLLGESPVWDSRRQALYWADQRGRKLRRFTPLGAELREWVLPHEIGCVVLTDDPDILLIAQPDHLIFLNVTSGASIPFVSIPQPRAGVRLSDGRCDRSGRLIAGSVTMDGGEGAGKIWRVSPNGRVELLREGMVIVNAICCAPAGDRLFYADSRGGVLFARSYDPSGGDAIGPEESFSDLRPHGGVPDGATIDSLGGIWIAQIMRGHILRLNSDGTLDRDIEMPAPHVSSLTFGGPNMDVLYVTSVSQTGMLIHSNHPLAGATFAITGLGVTGLSEGIFGIHRVGASAVGT
jgi:L-arabinonolactonase